MCVLLRPPAGLGWVGSVWCGSVQFGLGWVGLGWDGGKQQREIDRGKRQRDKPDKDKEGMRNIERGPKRTTPTCVMRGQQPLGPSRQAEHTRERRTNILRHMVITNFPTTFQQ